MLRGIYHSAAAMIAQQQKTEMLTNNLANINTPGFKEDQASLRSFPNMLIKAMDNSRRFPRSQIIGTMATGVYLQERMPNFTQGSLQETNNNTDLALIQGLVPINEETGLRGALLYVVQNENGEVRYTRNGSLAVDGQGFLVTSEGYYLLDTNGNPILVGNEDFQVTREGFVINSQGVQIAQIDVAFAENPMLLIKEGNGLFRYDGEGELPSAVGNPEVTYQIQQGFIERSNVDAQKTMTEMLSAYRAFEANQRVLQAYDRSLDKAVNEVGRVG